MIWSMKSFIGFVWENDLNLFFERRDNCLYLMRRIAVKRVQNGGKGERKKEERIKCKHKSFTLCVCASNENASIFA